jgi:hypothetical protein
MKKYMSNNKIKNSNGNGWNISRSLSNESGIALVVALLLMIVMVTMIPVAVQLTSGEFDRTENFQEKQDSFFIADAGMERLKSVYVNAGSTTALSGPDGDFEATADNGTLGGVLALEVIGGQTLVTFESDIDNLDHKYSQITFNGGDYKIRFWDTDDSKICGGTCTSGHADPALDSDNEDWVDRDGVVYAESIGTTADGKKTTIHATLKRRSPLTSLIPAAMTLVGPKASYRSGSNAGKVKGANASNEGFSIDGSADTDCAGKEGLVTEGEDNPGSGDWTDLFNPNASQADVDVCAAGTSNVCLGWSPSNSKNDVDGTSGIGTGIKTGVTDFTALHAEVFFDEFVVNNTPDQTLTTNGTSTDITDWGSPTNPVIIHAKRGSLAGEDGNLSLPGGQTGYGILVVDGELALSGTIVWNGIVIISGCDDCTGFLSGSGGFEVNGAVIVGNDGLDSSFDPTLSKSTYGGQPNYNYSCEGIDVANGSLSNAFLTASWNELVVD